MADAAGEAAASTTEDAAAAPTPAAEAPPAESPPAESPPAESPPAESPPAESPPAESPPESPAAESPPADVPAPAEASPAELPPAEAARAPPAELEGERAAITAGPAGEAEGGQSQGQAMLQAQTDRTVADGRGPEAPAVEEPDPAAVRPPVPMAVGGEERFKLEERLGAGNFGEVWKGTDSKTGKAVAVKLELKDKSVQGSLVKEYELLHDLKDPVQEQGFAEIMYFGSEGPYIYMAMEYLGLSLEDCLRKCGGKIDTKSTAAVAEQMLRRLEHLHSKAYIHRDIKPENIMFGLGPRAHIVYLVDFGLSEEYYEDDYGHLWQVKASLTGTPRYASINAHGYAQSRRDDLESLGYTLVKCLTGTLPWYNVSAPTEEEEDKLFATKKKEVRVDALCSGLPPAFAEYMTYVRAMGYKQRPNYAMLRRLFVKEQQQGQSGATSFPWLEGASNLEPIKEWTEREQPDDGDMYACCIYLGKKTRKSE
eukprot:TRINITY_DN33794_c0_g1_i1.p1 TRINITY_DN33794_c0_g1~~TRINITY_DN33794_c0_g1_i1.p1  ORF type:complete len:482 (-),score=138.43 TRINITY_DN33794_c0_g1_i1:85-1530(-)